MTRWGWFVALSLGLAVAACTGDDAATDGSEADANVTTDGVTTTDGDTPSAEETTVPDATEVADADAAPTEDAEVTGPEEVTEEIAEEVVEEVTPECAEGYQADGDDCVDIDECAQDPDPCPELTVCANEQGSHSCAPDGDGDGVADEGDVCPYLADPQQEDQDGDGLGDACDCAPESADPCEVTITAPTVAIEPGVATAGGALTCVVTSPSASSDGSPVSYIFSWEGGDQGPFIGEELVAEVTQACEVWACTATPSAGGVEGPTAQTSTLVLADACGSCPDQESDGDGDGVPDGQDNCPSIVNPDQTDVDTDGKGDPCDLCHLDGPTAFNAPGTVTVDGATFANVNINGGGSSAWEIQPGSDLNITVDYQITGVSCGPDGCPGCVTQYHIGLVGGNACDPADGGVGCFYSGSSGCDGQIQGTGEVDMKAPLEAGTYYLRTTYTWHFTCEEGVGWYKTPPPDHTIGAICVPEGEPPPPEAECGNGVVELGETCDDTGESETCNADCTVKGCETGEPTGEVIQIQAFDQELVNWADAHTTTVTFPEGDVDIASMSMIVDIACPSDPGDCDPWDRLGRLQVVDDAGENFEIGRFITPYDITGVWDQPYGTGPDTCSWVYDVSDYRSLLQGEKVLRMLIDTWIGGDDGWLMSVRFEATPGEPSLEAFKVVNLWNQGHLVYGNPANPVEDHLVPITLDIPEETVAARVRVTTTGHGQGNTDNAAEFAAKEHHISAGDATHTWTLWRDDCDQNVCSGQGGNWWPNRAGWCPGDRVYPHEVDVTSQITAEGTLTMDYDIEAYENCCDPNNAQCNANDASCCMNFAGECAYNYTGHTEPKYAMGSQLILYRKSCDP